MTENLLQKLEEKMMMLLTEIEDARKKIQRLTEDNAILKAERENHSEKLRVLISLLDTINVSDNMMQNSAISAIKPVLVQG